MKILSRSDFMKLPAGVVYCKGEPWVFGELSVKGETWSHCNDFLCLGLQWVDGKDSGEVADRMDEMLATGASYEDIGWRGSLYPRGSDTRPVRADDSIVGHGI